MSASPSLTPPSPSQLLNPQGVSDHPPRSPNTQKVYGPSVSKEGDRLLEQKADIDGDVKRRVEGADQNPADDERMELVEEVEELAGAGEGVELVLEEREDNGDMDVDGGPDADADAGPDADADAEPDAAGEVSLRLTR